MLDRPQPAWSLVSRNIIIILSIHSYFRVKITTRVLFLVYSIAAESNALTYGSLY